MKSKFRQMSFFLIIMAIAGCLSAYFGSKTSLDLPLYFASLTLLPFAGWLFLFDLYDFDYVKRHIEHWDAVGEPLTKDPLSALLFLSHKDTKPLDYSKLPSHSNYLGRWTVYRYRSGIENVELWHDHSIFGGRWYFIKY